MSNKADSEMEPIARLYCLRIDRWGLVRSTVKNHDRQVKGEPMVEKKNDRCSASEAEENTEKMKQKVVLQRLRKR